MGDIYSLQIGFPFIYYEQFQLGGSDFLNSEWNTHNLFLDCFITWIITTGLYTLLKYQKRIKNNCC